MGTGGGALFLRQNGNRCFWLANMLASLVIASTLPRDRAAPSTELDAAALRRFGLETSVRPSLAIYNDKSDIDALVSSLKHLAATRRG